MTTQDRFAVQRLREGIYLIGEPMHVNSYLVLGSGGPVLVVNSHYHFDHVGGNHLFDKIAIHESGAAQLQEGPPASWFPAYLEFTEAALAQYKVFRAIDQTWFQVLAPEMQMRPLPSSFDRRARRTVTSVPTRLLREGDELDLGDRALRVAHTPGHTHDSICLLDERRCILFSGDTIDTGPIYAHFGDSSVDDFAASACRLAEQEAATSTWCSRAWRTLSVLCRADILRRRRVCRGPRESCQFHPDARLLRNGCQASML